MIKLTRVIKSWWLDDDCNPTPGLDAADLKALGVAKGAQVKILRTVARWEADYTRSDADATVNTGNRGSVRCTAALSLADGVESSAPCLDKGSLELSSTGIDVNTLVDMGFARKEAEAALSIARGEVAAAVDHLLAKQFAEHDEASGNGPPAPDMHASARNREAYEHQLQLALGCGACFEPEVRLSSKNVSHFVEML